MINNLAFNIIKNAINFEQGIRNYIPDKFPDRNYHSGNEFIHYVSLTIEEL